MHAESSTVPHVQVVLSTYQPRQDWLEQQLESIWAQEGVHVGVVIRDDGSPDDTVARVERLLAGRPATLLQGRNVGATRSFLLGLRACDPDATHVAFADQDDIWLPGKLRRAVDTLQPIPPPAMYCSRVELVDQDLRPRGLHQLHRRGPSFANALVQNAATGSTIVMDRDAADLLGRVLPERAVLHDAWAYLVITGCGTVVYDSAPTVRYRQHDANLVGVARTRPGRWWGRLRRHLVNGHERAHTEQDRELAALLDDALRPDARELLHRHLVAADAALPRRCWWALTGPPHRQDLASDLVYRLLFTLGRT